MYSRSITKNTVAFGYCNGIVLLAHFTGIDHKVVVDRKLRVGCIRVHQLDFAVLHDASFAGSIDAPPPEVRSLNRRPPDGSGRRRIWPARNIESAIVPTEKKCPR